MGGCSFVVKCENTWKSAHPPHWKTCKVLCPRALFHERCIYTVCNPCTTWSYIQWYTGLTTENPVIYGNVVLLSNSSGSVPPPLNSILFTLSVQPNLVIFFLAQQLFGISPKTLLSYCCYYRWINVDTYWTQGGILDIFLPLELQIIYSWHH